jgi:peroxiredoxin
MLVEDGEVVKVFSEAGQEDNCPTDPFEVSDAGTMLTYIRGRNEEQAA